MNKLGRNDPCWCGSGKKYKNCHEHFDEEVERFRLEGHVVPKHEMIKTPEQIEGIRESGKINIAVLDAVAARIHEGMTTEEIDKIVSDTTTAAGAIAAPLNYEGFPKSVCTSVNDQVCQGIPSKDTVLKDGDIVNVDVSTIYKGYYSDSSRMFAIGKPNAERQNVMDMAKACMDAGIEQAKPWQFLGDIAQAIQDMAHSHGCTVVREVGGHGVGIDFHEEPYVSYVTKKGTDMLLVPGMIFTIEPMINAGRHDIFVDEENDWTIYTDDGKPSAQDEVTVLITEEGHEILAD